MNFIVRFEAGHATAMWSRRDEPREGKLTAMEDSSLFGSRHMSLGEFEGCNAALYR